MLYCIRSVLYIFETQFFTVFIFTGEFVDNTDNIISLTVSFINLCIKLLHSSSLSQLSHDKHYCCTNAVMYVLSFL